MTRNLRPCGTQSAYRRHLNRGEAPCAACRAANTARTNPTSPSALRVGEVEWGATLDANPPVITWRRKNNGIWVATAVHDPHAETGAQRAWDERMEREELRLERMQDEADAVDERFRKHHADNTPLQQAARTSI